MTPREIVKTSLRVLGALASGETPSAEEATDGLAALNRMIDAWSLEGLMIPAKTEETFTLSPGKQSYTMGPGGDFDTLRPQRIENAILRDDTASPPYDTGIDLVTRDEWVRISVKGTASDIPCRMWVSYENPLAKLSLYPKPSAARKLVLFSWKPIARFADLEASFEMPPGYEEAAIYGLAVRLAPEYGIPLREEIAVIASDRRAAIKRMNYAPDLLRVDDALVTRRSFDIHTGEYR